MALIVKADVAQYKQVTKANNKIMEQAIMDAELLDLIPLLGELLYIDLSANPASDKYKELLNKHAYTYNTYNYVSNGLKIVLAHLAYARYILFSGEIDTSIGLVEKNTQYSRTSEFIVKQRRSKIAEQIGYDYFRSVRDFLNRNESTYPLWNCTNERRTFKFNKISI